VLKTHKALIFVVGSAGYHGESDRMASDVRIVLLPPVTNEDHSKHADAHKSCGRCEVRLVAFFRNTQL
jgi:hypothetical protein